MFYANLHNPVVCVSTSNRFHFLIDRSLSSALWSAVFIALLIKTYKSADGNVWQEGKKDPVILYLRSVSAHRSADRSISASWIILYFHRTAFDYEVPCRRAYVVSYITFHVPEKAMRLRRILDTSLLSRLLSFEFGFSTRSAIPRWIVATRKSLSIHLIEISSRTLRDRHLAWFNIIA